MFEVTLAQANEGNTQGWEWSGCRGRGSGGGGGRGGGGGCECGPVDD